MPTQQPGELYIISQDAVTTGKDLSQQGFPSELEIDEIHRPVNDLRQFADQARLHLHTQWRICQYCNVEVAFQLTTPDCQRSEQDRQSKRGITREFFQDELGKFFAYWQCFGHRTSIVHCLTFFQSPWCNGWAMPTR